MNHMHPVVSVIVPVYNAAPFLRQTLDCICGQTLKEIEIILVDDGSTDETPAILQEYAARDSRIILLQQEHEYAGAARNKGMAIARGKYYSFLDADDLFEPSMLEKMVARAEEVGADVVVCRCDIFYKEGEYTPLNWQIHDRYLTRLNRKKFSLKKEYPQASFQSFIGWAWDKLFRAEYVKEHGFSFGPTRHGNDGPFVFPAIAGADCISIIDESLVKYRRSENQISSSGNLTKNPTAGCTSVDHIFASLKKMSIPDGVWQSFYVWVGHYMYWNMGKQTPDAREVLRAYLDQTFDVRYGILEQIERCQKSPECAEICRAHAKDLARYKSFVSPAISSVLPIYNAGSFLEEALDSLLAQSLTDWEAVCVNDGSTDNSLEILLKYAEKDTRIRVLDGPNGGYGKAMNRGMEAARGKYTAVFEPDDVLPAKAYEFLYEKAEQHQLDVVKGCGSRYVMEGNKRVVCNTPKFAPQQCNRIICPRRELQAFFVNMNTWTCLFRTDFLRQHSIWHQETPGASYQDNGLYFLSLAYADRVMYCNEVVYFCRRSNSNSSIYSMANKPFAMRDEYLYIRKKLQETPEIWQMVQEAWLRKRLDNHFFMYSNIRDSFKLEYLEDFRQELKEVEDIPRAILPEKAAKTMRNILISPLAYLITQMQEIPVTAVTPTPAPAAQPAPAKPAPAKPAPAAQPAPAKPAPQKKSRFFKVQQHKKELRILGIPVWSRNTKNGRCIYRVFGIRVRHKRIK